MKKNELSRKCSKILNSSLRLFALLQIRLKSEVLEQDSNNSRMVKQKFKQSIYKAVTIETIFHTFFNIPSLLLISITNDDS